MVEKEVEKTEVVTVVNKEKEGKMAATETTVVRVEAGIMVEGIMVDMMEEGTWETVERSYCQKILRQLL